MKKARRAILTRWPAESVCQAPRAESLRTGAGTQRLQRQPRVDSADPGEVADWPKMGTAQGGQGNIGENRLREQRDPRPSGFDHDLQFEGVTLRSDPQLTG